MINEPTQLKRGIGLPLLLFFGLGNIFGAGIYVLIGKVAGVAAMYTPVAFFIASLVAGFSAFTYGELSARYPYSAGEAVYIEEGLHIRQLSRLTGMLIAIAGMVSAATIARGFYGYFDQFIQLPEPVVIIAIVLFLGGLTAWGINESVMAASVLTIIELAGLLMIIYAGREIFAELHLQMEVLVPPASPEIWSGIMLGAFLAFFAFIGFEDMVNIAEEVKRPQFTLPAAILLALLIATIVYALVALVAIFTLDQQTLTESRAPLVDVLKASSDINPAYISVIGMLAVINGALIQIIMASRIFYGMAVRGWLWHKLASIHPLTQTPLVSTGMVTLIIMTLALFIPLEALAKATSLLILVVFTLVNLSLVIIKRREPPLQDSLNIPLWVPVTGFMLSIGLLLAQIIIGD
jgi:APA family basic amino acid/polyamine antiporter